MTPEEASSLKTGDKILCKWTCCVSTVWHNNGKRIAHWHKPFAYSYTSASEAIDQAWCDSHEIYKEGKP